MDAHSTETLRQQLLAQRNTLAGEIGSRQARSAESDHEVSDQKEQAAGRSADDLAAAEVEVDLAEVREIDAALDRLAAGRYGLCTDCGEAIAPARLKARPAAGRCMACQRAAEAARPAG